MPRKKNLARDRINQDKAQLLAYRFVMDVLLSASAESVMRDLFYDACKNASESIKSFENDPMFFAESELAIPLFTMLNNWLSRKNESSMQIIHLLVWNILQILDGIQESVLAFKTGQDQHPRTRIYVLKNQQIKGV